jgi:hypothetical protein
MNASREDRAPAAPAWQLEFARLIAFPAEAPLSMDQDWWHDLASEQPDDFVSTRKKHAREDRGSFQGVILSLRLDLHRIEWLIQPTVELEEIPGELPTIGPLREKVDWFVALLHSWLANSCPPLVRLAFAGKLLQAAATRQEAYRFLGGHLPGVNLDPNLDDFLFQVNRRRISNVVPGLPLNRISTWSKFNASFSVDPSATRTPFRWPEKCYSAVELDMNTAPETAEVLPRESLPGLFRELASLGVEIAERGDIP